MNFSSLVNISSFTESKKDEFSYFRKCYRDTSTYELLGLLNSARAKTTKLFPELIYSRTATREVLFEKYKHIGYGKYPVRELPILSEEEIEKKIDRYKVILKAIKAELAKREHCPNSQERKEIRQLKAFEKKHR